jgi:aspartate/methionine/tyrosine aminotransferase/prephenate dehydratase/prephenate dehydrogenase
MKIHYQGIPGCYSLSAISKFFPFTQTISNKSFKDVFENIDNDYALIPIENISGGRIEINFKFLIQYNYIILGEYNYLVEHALLAHKEANPKILKKSKVISHIQALKQCKNYLKNNELIATEFHDTAASGKYISDNNIIDLYCIANKCCSNIYNLKVIENNIQDVPKNITKFILVGKNRINNPINFYYKTTVLVDKLDTELLNKKIARVDTYNNQFYVDYIGKDKVINKIKDLGTYQVWDDLHIGIIGFGRFGKFLYNRLKKYAKISVYSRTHYENECSEFYFNIDKFLKLDLDCILFCNSILSFQEVIDKIKPELIKNKLLIDVLSVKKYPKNILSKLNADILCTHPMFGPDSASESWYNHKFIYEKINITDERRLNKFLNIFKYEGCKMIEMTCEIHDKHAAETQFITHLTGRILNELNLNQNEISSLGYNLLIKVKENTCKDSFDLFRGLFKFNPETHIQLEQFRKSLNQIENLLYQSNYNRNLDLIKASAMEKFDAQIRKMKNIVKFTIGNTDYPVHQQIKTAAINAIQNDKNNYTAVQGCLELRTEISKYLLEKKNLNYSPENIVCTNGAKHAIYETLYLLCNPEDPVVIFSPYWTSYPDMITLVRGKVIILDEIDQLKNIKAKIIIICNPCNPSGYIYNTNELKLIANYAKCMNAYIISDEIYERIDYNQKHTSMAKYYEKTFTINGFSKIYSMMGYRLGFVVAPTIKFAQELTKIQSQISSCACTISQYAGIAALKLSDSVIKGYLQELKKKRDYICNIFEISPPDGAIYAFIPNIDSQKLLDNYNIAIMPGSAFGKSDYVRICFANSWENLKLFENFKKIDILKKMIF